MLERTSKNFDAISSYTGLCLANSKAIVSLHRNTISFSQTQITTKD